MKAQNLIVLRLHLNSKRDFLNPVFYRDVSEIEHRNQRALYQKRDEFSP